MAAHTANVAQVHARIHRVIFAPAVHLEIKPHPRHESFINGLLLCLFWGLAHCDSLSTLLLSSPWCRCLVFHWLFIWQRCCITDGQRWNLQRQTRSQSSSLLCPWQQFGHIYYCLFQPHPLLCLCICDSTPRTSALLFIQHRKRRVSSKGAWKVINYIALCSSSSCPLPPSPDCNDSHRLPLRTTLTYFTSAASTPSACCLWKMERWVSVERLWITSVTRWRQQVFQAEQGLITSVG